MWEISTPPHSLIAVNPTLPHSLIVVNPTFDLLTGEKNNNNKLQQMIFRLLVDFIFLNYIYTSIFTAGTIRRETKRMPSPTPGITPFPPPPEPKSYFIIEVTKKKEPRRFGLLNIHRESGTYCSFLVHTIHSLCWDVKERKIME